MYNPDRCPSCHLSEVHYVEWLQHWVWNYPGLDEDGTPPPLSFCANCGFELPDKEEMECPTSEKSLPAR